MKGDWELWEGRKGEKEEGNLQRKRDCPELWSCMFSAEREGFGDELVGSRDHQILVMILLKERTILPKERSLRIADRSRD